jgi:hypothetical protein
MVLTMWGYLFLLHRYESYNFVKKEKCMKEKKKKIHLKQENYFLKFKLTLWRITEKIKNKRERKKKRSYLYGDLSR